MPNHSKSEFLIDEEIVGSWVPDIYISMKNINSVASGLDLFKGTNRENAKIIVHQENGKTDVCFTDVFCETPIVSLGINCDVER